MVAGRGEAEEKRPFTATAQDRGLHKEDLLAVERYIQTRSLQGIQKKLTKRLRPVNALFLVGLAFPSFTSPPGLF